MSNFKWYTKGLIIIIVICVLAAIGWYGYMNMNKKEAIPAYGLGTSVTGDASSTVKYTIYREDGTSVNLPGREWNSSTTTTDVLPYDVDAVFVEGYDKELLAQGWTRGNIVISGMRIYAPANDSELSRTWGYFRVDGDNLYTVAIKETILPAIYAKATATASSTSSGPYVYTYTVFMANPISISYLLK